MESQCKNQAYLRRFQSVYTRIIFILGFSLSFIFQLQTYAAEFVPKTFKAQFEQSFASPLKRKLRTGNGVISYKYPGHIRLEILEPNSDRTTFVCNPKKSWYYSPPFDEKTEKGQVVIHSAEKLQIVKFFDTIRDGLKSNQHYDVKRSNSNSKNKQDNFVEIIFKGSVGTEIGVKSAKIYAQIKSTDITFKAIEMIELTYPDDKKIKLTLKNIEENPTFTDKVFEFEIPVNTTIVDR
ncbi:MAG: outer membrane lipoprotein carrier protein LolA [Oligoflexia bacterium]|nr:outer membrane lipoprotein carrier protein LolA [Oligoflexia bacterium]